MKLHYNDYPCKLIKTQIAGGVDIGMTNISIEYTNHTELMLCTPATALKALSLPGHNVKTVALIDMTPEGIQFTQSTGSFRVLKRLDSIDLMMYAAEYQCFRGFATHYFLDSPELLKFCMKATPPLNKRLFDALITSDNDSVGSWGVIHAPGGNEKPILFGYTPVWDEGNKIVHDYMIVLNSELSGCYFIDDDTLPYLSKVDTVVNMLRTVLGVGLYAKCFPSAIHEGLPSFAKHPAHYKNKPCISVNIDPQLLSRSGPIPHIRRGHFRLLQSDRYKNKQGEVIFVSETFVKGTAKTVEDIKRG